MIPYLLAFEVPESGQLTLLIFENDYTKDI